jgi:hypothetical protein
MTKAVDDSVDIIKMLPDKTSNAIILGDGFVSPFWGLIMRSGAMDGSVIKEGFSNIRHLWLEEKGDITMKNCNCIGGTLREYHASISTKGCLKCGKIS